MFADLPPHRPRLCQERTRVTQAVAAGSRPSKRDPQPARTAAILLLASCLSGMSCQGPTAKKTATTSQPSLERAAQQKVVRLLDQLVDVGTRTFVGPDFHANRLGDWRVQDGAALCVRSAYAWPYRTLHVTTWELADSKQPGNPASGLDWQLSVEARNAAQAASDQPMSDDAAVAYLLAPGGAGLDPRASALVAAAPGPDGGLLLGMDGTGHLFARPFTAAAEVPIARSEKAWSEGLRSMRLTLHVHAPTAADASGARAVLTASPANTPNTPQLELAFDLEPCFDRGTVALVSHPGTKAENCRPVGFGFSNLSLRGDRFRYRPECTQGPVVSCLYTRSQGTLRLTAQCPPLPSDCANGWSLQTRSHDALPWREIAQANRDLAASTVRFSVEDDESLALQYRVLPALPFPTGSSGTLATSDAANAAAKHGYTGMLRAAPTVPGSTKLAAMSCVHQVRFGYGKPGFPWNRQGLWFPHDDLTRHVAAADPDLLFFAGDQIYEGASPTRADKSGGESSRLDYFYKWLLWCVAFRELTRERPAVVIPDDHDIFQGNLWGAGGRSIDRDTKGGYVMPPDWVAMVERTQTSHLPAPADPNAAGPGFRAYFTNLVWGGVDFAILEDRKFKSGPLGTAPETGSGRPDHILDPEFDPETADVAGATLLGPRQLAWLHRWGTQWRGIQMKCALSQTVFAGLATHHGSKSQYLVADYDSNGWPQTGRNRALHALRIPAAIMIGGDQHLASLAQHGIDDFGDAGWSFCMPAAANFYPRSWMPPVPPALPISKEWVQRVPSAAGLEHLGSYRDGFGNRVTMAAHTNPVEQRDAQGALREPPALHGGMPGFGIVVFDTASQTIEVQCWPRHQDPTAPNAVNYPGWPVTLTTQEQDGRTPAAWLADIEVHGVERPAVTVTSTASGEITYSRRVDGPTIRLPVFAGDQGPWNVRLEDLKSGRRVDLTGMTPGPKPWKVDWSNAGEPGARTGR